MFWREYCSVQPSGFVLCLLFRVKAPEVDRLLPKPALWFWPSVLTPSRASWTRRSATLPKRCCRIGLMLQVWTSVRLKVE